MRIDDFWAKAVTARAASLTPAEPNELVSDALSSAPVRELDRRSLADLCAEAGLSDEAIEFERVASRSLAERKFEMRGAWSRAATRLR